MTTSTYNVANTSWMDEDWGDWDDDEMTEEERAEVEKVSVASMKEWAEYIVFRSTLPGQQPTFEWWLEHGRKEAERIAKLDAAQVETHEEDIDIEF